jgi:hypothetical protein
MHIILVHVFQAWNCWTYRRREIRPNRAWQFITPTTWFWALCAPCLLVDLAKKSGRGASGSSRRAKEHVNLDYKITKRDKTLGAFP